jgi:uncharacterized protein YecE (DUF72 family)
MNTHCHIGTSGWVYPHWRGVFYPPDLPQSRWFDYYSQHFATVEINSSFYRLPAETTFDRWQAQAPPGFIYAVKANRFLTHLKRLKDVAEPLERFLSRARRLGDTLGPILWQLPPHWHADPVRLESFATLLPTDVTNVFEFRDPKLVCSSGAPDFGAVWLGLLRLRYAEPRLSPLGHRFGGVLALPRRRDDLCWPIRTSQVGTLG